MEKETKSEPLFVVTKDNIWKILTVVLAVALIFILLRGGNDAPAAPSGNQELGGGQAAPEVVDVSPDDDAVKGDKNAPVEIIEFSDYQCPFCERFYKETLPQLDEEYIKTGKAKLVYRDFALSFHPFAQKAAEAAECARDQKGDEMYYLFHNKIFENQQNIGVDALKGYASGLGLDTGKFNTCLDSGKFAQETQKDFQAGQAAGVSGTPSFFINGKKVVGAQPFAVFKQIIDAELAN